MESGYQQEPVGGGRVRFTVRAAPPPRSPGPALALATLFGLLVVGTAPAAAEPVEVAVRLAVAAAGGAWLHGWTHRWLARRIDRVRSPGGSFVVSPLGLAPESGRIERDRLQRLVIRNGVDGAAGPAGPIAGPVHPRARLGWLVRRADAVAVAYLLCAESDGRSTILAGGMTEATALGLQTDVIRVLGGGKPAVARVERGAGAIVPAR